MVEDWTSLSGFWFGTLLFTRSGTITSFYVMRSFVLWVSMNPKSSDKLKYSPYIITN